MMMLSPRRHSVSLNGPVQSTFEAIASLPLASTNFLLTTSCTGSIRGNTGHGADSLNCTVEASTTTVSSSGPSRSLRGLVWPPIAFGFVRRSKVNLMSSAVSVSPEWNLTFARSFA